jgi:hypothetical protein
LSFPKKAFNELNKFKVIISLVYSDILIRSLMGYRACLEMGKPKPQDCQDESWDQLKALTNVKGNSPAFPICQKVREEIATEE